MKRPHCSFCNQPLTATSPINKDPCFRCFRCFRCYTCNIRTQITNQSYLPEDLRKYYWHLVLSQKLMKQEWPTTTYADYANSLPSSHWDSPKPHWSKPPRCPQCTQYKQVTPDPQTGEPIETCINPQCTPLSTMEIKVNKTTHQTNPKEKT